MATTTTTDPAINVGIGGVNVAFLAHMLKILEDSNNSTIPFFLPFKNGQGKVGFTNSLNRQKITCIQLAN